MPACGSDFVDACQDLTPHLACVDRREGKEEEEHACLPGYGDRHSDSFMAPKTFLPFLCVATHLQHHSWRYVQVCNLYIPRALPSCTPAFPHPRQTLSSEKTFFSSTSFIYPAQYQLLALSHTACQPSLSVARLAGRPAFGLTSCCRYAVRACSVVWLIVAHITP